MSFKWADLSASNAALSLYTLGAVQCVLITSDKGSITAAQRSKLKSEFGFRDVKMIESPEALTLATMRYTAKDTKKLNIRAIPFQQIAEVFDHSVIREMEPKEALQLWEGLEKATAKAVVSTMASKRTQRALQSYETIGFNEAGREIHITSDDERFYRIDDTLYFSKGPSNDFLEYYWNGKGIKQAAKDLLRESQITGRMVDANRIDRAIEFGEEKLRLTSERASGVHSDLCYMLKVLYLTDLQQSSQESEISAERLNTLNNIVSEFPKATRGQEKSVLPPAFAYITRKYLEAVDNCDSLSILNTESLGANVLSPPEIPVRIISPESKYDNVYLTTLSEQLGAIPYTATEITAINAIPTSQVLFSSQKMELDEPVNVGAITVKRKDHYEMLSALKAMKQDASGVFIIGADNGFDIGTVGMDSFPIHDYVFKNYNVLETVDVAPIVSGDNREESAKRIYIINGRKPVPSSTAAPTEINALFSVNDVHAFANTLDTKFKVDLQQEIKSASELLTSTSVSDILASYTSNQRLAAKYDLNFAQARYTPLTSIAPANDMSAMPTNFVNASREAAVKLVRDVGNPDSFLVEELGMDAEMIAEKFDAEQIDAITMGIWRLKNGKPFLQGDATGKGKGRTLAAMMYWASRNGLEPVFMTSTSDLLSDIWRDIRDIGADTYLKPLIIAGEDTAIIDKDDNSVIIDAETIKGTRQAQFDSKSYRLQDTNMVLTVYSQYNRLGPAKNGRKKVKLVDRLGNNAKWMLEYSARRNPLFVMDESHNVASTTSNQANVIELFTNATRQPILRSSATWAKSANNIAQCADLLPPQYSADVLRRMVSRGGTGLQEVLSTTLIAEGAMVRREHNFGKRKVDIIESEDQQRNRIATDEMSRILQRMRVYTKHQFELYKRSRSDMSNTSDLNIEEFSFHSTFALISDGFTNAMRADAVAKAAVEAVTNNEKPIIGIDKTAESALKFLFDNVKEEGESSVVLDEFPDFRVMLLRWIENAGTRRYKEKIEPTPAEIQAAAKLGQKAEPTFKTHVVSWREELSQGSPEYQELEVLEKELIRSLDGLPSLPLSPIDVVKLKLADEGISCGEVSGRTLHIRKHEDGQRFVIEPRNRESKAEAQFRFNSHKDEAIILTRSGTEGISLHAAAELQKYGKEAINPRHVMLMGTFLNVVDEEQFFGRGERKGQVVLARSSKVVTGMPIEARTLALSERNRLRLSASTTGNSKSVRATETLPNLLNAFGDEVVTEYLVDHPDVIDQLGFTETKRNAILDYGSAAFKRTQVANLSGSVLGHMMLLDYAQQNALLDDITNFYRAKLTSLQARGLDPINTKNLRGSITILNEEKLVGDIKEHYESEFDKPVLVQSIQIKSPPVSVDPSAIESDIKLSQDKLDLFVEKKGASLGDLALYVMQHKNEVLMHKLNKHNTKVQFMKHATFYHSVSDALSDNNSRNEVKIANEDVTRIITILRNLELGGVYRDFYDRNHGMVITGITLPRKMESILDPYSYSVQTASTNGELNRDTTFESLLYFSNNMEDELKSSFQGVYSRQHPICEQFEGLKLEGATSHAVVLTGNIVEAARINAEAQLGSQVMLVDSDTKASYPAIKARHGLGLREIMSKSFSATDDDKNLLIKGHEMGAINGQLFIFDHKSATDTDAGKKEGTIMFGHSGKFVVRMPKTKAGCMGLGVADPFDGREASRSTPNARTGLSLSFNFNTQEDLVFVLDRLSENGFDIQMSGRTHSQLESVVSKIESSATKTGDIEDQMDIEDVLSSSAAQVDTTVAQSVKGDLIDEIKTGVISKEQSQDTSTVETLDITAELPNEQHAGPDEIDMTDSRSDSNAYAPDEVKTERGESAPEEHNSVSLMSELDSQEDEEIYDIFAASAKM